MAGLNLLINLSESAENLKPISETQDNKLTTHEIWEHSHFVLNTTVHDGYPYEVFDNELFSVYLEGKVYNLNKMNLKKELEKLFVILSSIEVDKEAITNSLFKLDGDYVLIFFDKANKKLFLLNDVYGRLPLYYGENQGKLMISRNMDRIINKLELTELDKFGTAEYLVFGHTVTDRTMIKDIQYFLPGSLLSCDLDMKSYDTQNIFTYNFESLVTINSHKYQDELNESIEFFKKAVEDRIDSKSVIGLSGGLDSRVLVAGFSEIDSMVECVSRLSFNKREAVDVALAKEVCNILNMELKVIEPSKPQESDLYELIKLKSGINSIENDFNLVYEKELQALYGNKFTYFTGDAGDRIKPHIRIRNASSLTHFVEKLITTYCSFDLTQVAQLLELDINKFKENIHKYVDSFPEKSYAYKDLHFRIYSRGFRYVVEGEDRKRNFFWTATPFYSHEFFISAMSFPDDYKRDYKMVFEFLNSINPKLNNVINKNWGIKPSSKLLPFYLLKDRIPRKWKLIIKNCVKKKSGRRKGSSFEITGDIDVRGVYNERVYESLVSEINSDRLKHLFIMTPLILKDYLDKLNKS